jgi:MFS family permease
MPRAAKQTARLLSQTGPLLPNQPLLGGVNLNERVLTTSRRTINSMLCSAQGGIGACFMDIITLVAFIISIYLAGRMAERRGRRFKIWAWIAAFIGPLALPLVFLFPNLHRNNGEHA